MNAVTTITSKSQVTIPKDVRETLNLRAKDRLLVTIQGDYIVMIPMRSRPLSELFGALPVDRPYPGHDAIREEIRRELGQRDDYTELSTVRL